MKQIAILMILTLFLISSCSTQPNASEFEDGPGDLVVCTTDAKECPDGSFVGRSGPDCEFAACPEVVETTPEPAETAPENTEVAAGPENDVVDHSSERGKDTYVEDNTFLTTGGTDIIQRVNCDINTHKLEVDLKIPDNSPKSYELKKMSQFDTGDDVALTRLSVNGRQITNLETYCGQSRLAPSESTTCTMPFVENEVTKDVMIRTGYDEFAKPLPNRIHLSSAYLSSDVTFVCQ